MKEADLKGILDFLRGAEQLKSTLRTAYMANGRVESTAEHTWRLCLMVSLFEAQYPDVDMLKLIKMCIIHDLGEAVSGDISAVDQLPGSNKSVEERKDLKLLLQPLPQNLKDEILALWDEYENASTKEAQLAKAFDKIETILQHIQGKNPANFDYGFNLGYGKQYTDFDEITSSLRSVLDKDTTLLANASRK